MTPAQRDTLVEVADNEDVQAAIDAALTHADVSLEQLRTEARRSQFSSERARMAWFVVSPFVGTTPTPSPS
jgi:hypothetical protein